MATVATTVTLAIPCPSSRSSPVHLLADLFYEIWVLGLHLLRQLPPSGNTNLLPILVLILLQTSEKLKFCCYTVLRQYSFSISSLILYYYYYSIYPPLDFYTSMYKLFSFSFPVLYFSSTYQSNPNVACLLY